MGLEKGVYKYLLVGNHNNSGKVGVDEKEFTWISVLFIAHNNK